MLSYNDLYEVLRKEKYSEVLQTLPKNFLGDFADYLELKKEESSGNNELFDENSLKVKKQLENSMAIFKELVLRRKKKLLNLVFVAAETGIMKRDYENMLQFEKEIFDRLIKAFEEGDREMYKAINSKREGFKDVNRMIIFLQDVDQFVAGDGIAMGPYNKGQLANLDLRVSELFVSAGKARYVDENV